MKCEHLRIGPVHQFGFYYLNDTEIATTTAHKDLGVLLDHHLKFHNHTTEVTAKANRMLGMIERSFEHLDSSMVTKLFTAKGCPTLEYYGNAIWGPHFVLDQRKVERIEPLSYCCHSKINPMPKG